MPSVTSRRPRWINAAAIAIAGVLALSACTAPDETTQPASSAEISLAILGAPPTLAPTGLDDGQSAYIWTALFDTLLVMGNDGVLSPNAAESWEYSDDALHLTLHLRDGMTFSNGDAVTASDVVATLMYIKDNPGSNQYRVDSVDTVEATDDLTVVINFSRPDAAFVENLAFGIGAIGHAGTLDDEDTALRPIGSGPYVLDEAASVDGSSYVLTRRDDHWDADAYPFSKLNLRVIADPAAIFNALQAGEISAATVRPDQAAQIENSEFTLTPIGASNLASLLILDRSGTIVPALADVRVRQAINMAVDRAGFVKNVLGGNGQPTEQIFNPKSDVYDPELVDTYPFDLDAARALLEEAGYADGFAVTLPSTFISTTFEPLLTAALDEIGITATWEAVPAQEIASSVSSGKYAMAFFVRGFTTPAKDITDYYSATGFLGGINTPTEDLSSLLDEAARTIDPDAAAETQRKINRLAVEDAYGVPLFTLSETWATKAGVKFLGDGSTAFPTIRLFGVTD